MTLRELNERDCRGFADAVGWAFERSPWVAARAWTLRPFESLAALHEAMAGVVAAASREEQLALLRAHPELAANAATNASAANPSSMMGLNLPTITSGTAGNTNPTLQIPAAEPATNK